MSRTHAALLTNILLLTACGGGEHHSSGNPPTPRTLPWQTLTTAAFDASNGQTGTILLSTAEQRQALRVSAAADQCFQVVSALSRYGSELSRPFARRQCPDCGWRTAVIQGAGLLVLEGPAQDLTTIRFGRVNCDTLAALDSSGTLRLETLSSERPAKPTITLRLVLSDRVHTTLDTARLATDVAAELGIDVQVAATLTIADTDILLSSSTDIGPLQALLADLPVKDEGLIDVVIGPCLEQSSAFGTQRLAGITPRIPGGTGAGDAVFIARRSCGSRNEAAADPAETARLAAHELGHYLGLQHPAEADGTLDDFADTDTHNLMHREPLRADASGLTEEQRARMLAHPFVMSR